MKRLVFFVFWAILIIPVLRCGGDSNSSSEKLITAFSIVVDDKTIEGNINQSDFKIEVTIPHEAPLSPLVAHFTISQGATVNIGGKEQKSGITSNDFSQPVTYSVVAEDGSSQNYIVTVMNERVIQFLSIGGNSVNFNKTYGSVLLPYDTDLKNIQIDCNLIQGYSLFFQNDDLSEEEVTSGQFYDLSLKPAFFVKKNGDNIITNYSILITVISPRIEALTVSGYGVNGGGATSVLATVSQPEAGSSLVSIFNVELPKEVKDFETDNFKVTFDFNMEDSQPLSDFDFFTDENEARVPFQGNPWSNSSTVVSIGNRSEYFICTKLKSDPTKVNVYKVVFTKSQ